MEKIRALNRSRDHDGLIKCIIAIQDHERKLIPTMPKGADIADAYADDIYRKCVDQAGHVLVCTIDKKVIAYVTIYTRMISSEIDDGHVEYGLIGDLVVLEDYRGRGIGRKLLHEAELLAKSHHVKTLRVAVLSANTTAVELYQSSGFMPYTQELEKTL